MFSLPILDRFDRPMRNLRISVTDRCNLRCDYCMPEETYQWLPRRDILSFEEIARLVDAFCLLGVDKVRLTGGEPLLRRELAQLVRLLSSRTGIRDLAMTTNGVHLAEHAATLKDAGLHRLTLSLDTLRRDRFQRLTRRDDLDRVLSGLYAATQAGFEGTKLNAVVMRGVNDDELPDLIALAARHKAEVRFIEYMDVGGATKWDRDVVVPQEEILERIADSLGTPEPVEEGRGSAPARRFRLPSGAAVGETRVGGEVFGLIASTTSPFCGACDRSRITADGTWFACLYAPEGEDLREPLRRGEGPDELARRLSQFWTSRADRGAEERVGTQDRTQWVPTERLKSDPHLEMHTRGG